MDSTPACDCGVHAVGGIIFDLAVKQQPERASVIRFAEIEFETVQFGEAGELGQGKITEIAMRQQIGKDVVPVLIVRRGWRTRVAAGHYFEIWIWRIAGKIFVRINVNVRGMIDRQQLYLIEVNCLFERLHEAEAELAIFFANGVAIDFYVFRGARNVALAGAYPVADDASAEHVSDELVAFTVPNEKRGAGTATAVNFHVFLFAIGGYFDFILQNSGRPEHADDVGLCRLSEADGEVRRVLP